MPGRICGGVVVGIERIMISFAGGGQVGLFAWALLLDSAVQGLPAAPTDLVAFQWVALGALASVIVALARQLMKEYDRNREMLTMVLEALGTNSTAMKAMEDVAHNVTTLTEIRDRLNRIEGGTKNE